MQKRRNSPQTRTFEETTGMQIFGFLLLAGALGVPLSTADAADAEVADSDFGTSPGESGRDLSLEFSVLWPVVPANLFAVQGLIELWRQDGLRGELVLGLMYQPRHSRDDEGRYTALEARIGYRQYLWRELHIEGVGVTGYESLNDNVFDGEDYEGVGLNVQGVIGYVFRYRDFYANLQPLGIAYTVGKINAWPLDDDLSTDESPIYLGNLWLGYRW